MTEAYDMNAMKPEQILKEYWKMKLDELNVFTGIFERDIGNTHYIVETICDGTEHLSDKIKRRMLAETAVA